MAEDENQPDPGEQSPDPDRGAASQQPAQGGDTESVEQSLAEAQDSLDEMRDTVEQATGTDAAAGDATSANTAQATADDASAEGQSVQMPYFDAGDQSADRGIELLGDVDLDVSVELGRSEMLVEDVLRLGAGSVVELDKLAGDPVDVYVNGRLVARGEVLVLNDNFCIRISEIVANLEEEADLAAQQNQGDS